MKPFAIYIVKNASSKKQIAGGTYSHLLFESKLPQFPNIIVKKSDLVAKTKKNNFKLLLCHSQEVKEAQLTALKVKSVIVIDTASPALEAYLKDNLMHLQVHNLAEKINVY